VADTAGKGGSVSSWQSKIAVVQGDITDEDCDVIVNAANSELAPGGGVCGAIHRAAGPRLARACAAIGFCAPGEAVMTAAYDLPCRRVIHTVGPIWGGGAGELEDELLASCYAESLRLAASAGLASIAFPCISTGSYGFPPDRACQVALAAVRSALAEHPDIAEVRFVCWLPEDADRYERALAGTDEGGDDG
jgi:O-acetyl-ADP-ribose deacetylase (regulator of RNase III)